MNKREAQLEEFCRSLPKAWRLMTAAERDAFTRQVTTEATDHDKHAPGEFPVSCKHCFTQWDAQEHNTVVVI